DARPSGPRLHPGARAARHGVLPPEEEGAGGPRAGDRAEAEGGAAGPGARGEGRPGARLPGGAAARGEAARGGTVTPGAWLALAAPTVCLLLPPPWVAAQGAPATQAPPAAAPAARGPSFDQLAKKAAAAKEAGQLDDAIRYYGQALAMRPAWAQGRWA